VSNSAELSKFSLSTERDGTAGLICDSSPAGARVGEAAHTTFSFPISYVRKDTSHIDQDRRERERS
jgi:hypothetical protein